MEPKTERVALRMSPSQLDLLREAAQVEGRNLTDFVTSAVTSHANDVLADQRVFRLTGERWAELTALLDAAPRSRPNLVRALRDHAERVKS